MRTRATKGEKERLTQSPSPCRVPGGGPGLRFLISLNPRPGPVDWVVPALPLPYFSLLFSPNPIHPQEDVTLWRERIGRFLVWESTETGYEKQGSLDKFEEPSQAPFQALLQCLAGSRGALPSFLGGIRRAYSEYQGSPFCSQVKNRVKSWCLAPPCGRSKFFIWSFQGPEGDEDSFWHHKTFLWGTPADLFPRDGRTLPQGEMGVRVSRAELHAKG